MKTETATPLYALAVALLMVVLRGALVMWGIEAFAEAFRLNVDMTLLRGIAIAVAITEFQGKQ